MGHDVANPPYRAQRIDRGLFLSFGRGIVLSRRFSNGIRYGPAANLLSLGSSLGLGAEVGGGATVREEAADQGLEEGVEDKLGAAVFTLATIVEGTREIHEDSLGLGKGHPQDKDKLEDVVEGYCRISMCLVHWSLRVRTEPVGSVDGALNQSQESEDNPVLNRWKLEHHSLKKKGVTCA